MAPYRGMIWAKLTEGIFDFGKQRPSLRDYQLVSFAVHKHFQITHRRPKLFEVRYFHDFHFMSLPWLDPELGTCYKRDTLPVTPESHTENPSNHVCPR